MLTVFKQIYASIKSFIDYCAIAGCIYLFAWLPLNVAAKLASCLSHAWKILDSANYQRAIRHSRERLGLTEQEAVKFADSNFKHYLTGMMEFSRLLRMDSQEVLSCIDDTGFDRVMQQAAKSSKGVLLASCHMGNWIWFSTYLAIKGHIAGHIINPFKNRRIDKLITKIRTRHGCILWHKHGAITKAAKALKRGQGFSLMLDLDLGKNAWMSPFLGKPASTNFIPIELAAKMSSPIVIAALVRANDQPLKFKLIFTEPIIPATGEQQEVKKMLDEVNNRLSNMIMEFPSQWWWQYRRWRTKKVSKAKKARHI